MGKLNIVITPINTLIGNEIVKPDSIRVVLPNNDCVELSDLVDRFMEKSSEEKEG